jgi:hypothetical protein
MRASRLRSGIETSPVRGPGSIEDTLEVEMRPPPTADTKADNHNGHGSADATTAEDGRDDHPDNHRDDHPDEDIDGDLSLPTA